MVRSVPKLLGRQRLKENLGLVGNRIAFPNTNETIRTALMGMMSETTGVSRPELIDYVLNLCEHCDLGLNEFVKSVGRMIMNRESPVETVAKRIKRVTVKSFMDAWTLNVERLQQCCVHVGSTDPDADVVRVPFCARQLFTQLRRRTSAGQLPAAGVIRLDQIAKVKR